MAVTAIGTNVLTSIGRQYVMPEFVDNVYGGNLLFWRWNQAKKKSVQGGTQIESPLMYKRFTNGGSFRGFDIQNIAPNDTIKDGAWDWKQYYVPVSVDSLTLAKVESPDAIANFIATYFAIAEIEMAANLGGGLWQTGTDAKGMDSVPCAVDSSDPPAAMGSYGGLARASNTWWAAQEDTSTTTLTLSALNTMHGLCRSGGQRTTLIISTQANYNRYWNLSISAQTNPNGGAGHDAQLAAAGFDNLIFNGSPWAVDDNISSNTEIYFLNEVYWSLIVHSKYDFLLYDFVKPADQSAFAATIEWMGNPICTNCRRQGKFSAITA